MRLKKSVPAFSKWVKSIGTFSIWEKLLFFVFLIGFVCSIFFLVNSFYNKNTEIVPSFGGEIKEGVIGQPKHINPIYSSLSDVDEDLVELIFSGLMKYNKQGEIVPDLIEEYYFDESGKILNFKIKEGILWQDKTPLTIDDIIFTFNILQDPEYLSPIRANFQGVSIEKISDTEARFKLIDYYAGFLENLTDLKIIPKHIFENVLVQDFSSDENLNIFSPIGSGPYMVEKVKKNGSVHTIYLKTNKLYYGQKPYIEKITFIFYGSEEELKEAVKKGRVDLAHLSINDLDKDYLSFLTPNYFGLFLNTQNELFKKESIREALALAIDKENILNNVLGSEGYTVSSPILPVFYGEEEIESIYDIQKAVQIFEANDFLLDENGVRKQTIEKIANFTLNTDLTSGDTGKQVEKLQECLANFEDIYPDGTISSYFGQKTKEAVIKFQEKYKEEILEPNNLAQGNGKVGLSTRTKLNELCFPSENKELAFSFTIKTSNHPVLTAVAKNVKDQLEQIGIKVEIELYNNSEIKYIIRERDYDILLFGEKLGTIRNPMPYWHSTQIFDPGLNLSLWENEEADTLLESIRVNNDFEDLNDFQELFLENNPAVLLYSPNYIYYANDKIKGISSGKVISPSQRFSDVSNWYIKTKRIWK